MPDLYQDRTLTLRGLRFHYLDWGTEGKPPFVCLHGGAQTAHSWDDFAPVAGAYRFHKEIPGSKLVLIERAGHFAFEDEPERCATEIVEFLAESGV